MAPASKLIAWDGQDAFITGNHGSAATDATILFEVPTTRSDLKFGRIFSGKSWPAGLPTLDRIAALPSVEGGEIGAETSAADVVLYLEPEAGGRIPLCARAGGGRVCWSFDPTEWIRGLLAERYVRGWQRPLPSRIPVFNYSRLPHFLKGWLQRFAEAGGSAPGTEVPFPQLPFDPLVETIRGLCSALARGGPTSSASPWPDGRRAAVTLTHDVDTSWILEPRREPVLRGILDAETALGYSGCWYVTADQLHPDRQRAAIGAIREAGHEIGSHGWNHDARLAGLSSARQERRMQRILERFSDLGIEGFRAPWYDHSSELFGVVSRFFSYDSSVLNATPLFGSGSHTGCCTIFPYEACSGLMELPLTLPAEISLPQPERYDVLGRIADAIIERGGVVVVTVHPQPHQSATQEELAAYAGFLRRLAERHGDALWHATPGEIVRHYRSALQGGVEPGA